MRIEMLEGDYFIRNSHSFRYTPFMRCEIVPSLRSRRGDEPFRPISECSNEMSNLVC